MKKVTLLFIITLLFPFLANSQAYHRLLDNSSWCVSWAGMYGSGHGSLSMLGDTLINSISYNIIVNKTNMNPICYAREDSLQKKVWAIYNGQPAELLIYDFSLTQGQQITLTDVLYGGQSLYTVTSVDSVSTNAGYRKRVNMETSASQTMSWIEQVGHLWHPFYFKYGQTYETYELECSHQNTNLIYLYDNALCDSCYATSVAELLVEAASLTICHDPVNGSLQFHIENPGGEELQLYVFNSLGQVEYSYLIGSSLEQTLNIPLSGPGLYFAALASGNNTVSRKFIFAGE